MKKEIIFGAILIFGLGMTSCKKKGCTDEAANNYSADAKKDDGSCTYDTTTPPDDPYTADFKSFYDAKRDAETQTFTIDPTIWNEIEGAEGTKLQIPANTFVDASGTPVTSTVTVSLLEILDQDDMIRLNAPTVSSGSYLISGGELRVTASSGGADVFVAASSSVGLFVPTTDPDPAMGIFDGVEDASGDIIWTSVDSADIVIVVDSTGMDSTDYYWYDWSDSDLGWINCDYFWSDPSPKTTLTAHVSGDHLHDNTVVFIHFSTLSSIANLWPVWGDVDNNSFESYIESLPIGMELTIVAISELSGNYYSAIVPITLVDDHEENLTMSATTLTEFEAAIAAL